MDLQEATEIAKDLLSKRGGWLDLQLTHQLLQQ